MLFGIYVRCDLSSCSVYPSITIGVICMPMSIEQLCDRVRTKAVEGLNNPCLRHSETGVNKKFAVLSCENSNISSRAFQNADISAKRILRNCRFCRRIDHRWNDALALCEEGTGSKGKRGCGGTGNSDEVAAREIWQLGVIHGFSNVIARRFRTSDRGGLSMNSDLSSQSSTESLACSGLFAVKRREDSPVH